MRRGPYYKTVTAIGHPVRTSMRSSAADDVISGILIMSFWMLVGMIVFSPIWVPLWLVNEMYEEWHPALATLAAVPFLAAVTALYVWIYLQYDAYKNPKPVTVTVPLGPVGEIRMAPYPADALRSKIMLTLQGRSKGDGDDLVQEQYQLAKAVKRSFIDDWHVARKEHGIGYETQVIDERIEAIEKVIDELFNSEQA